MSSDSLPSVVVDGVGVRKEFYNYTATADVELSAINGWRGISIQVAL